MYVYVIRSVKNPKRYYTGRTADPAQRIQAHNAGSTKSTARHRPWEYVIRVWFADEKRAFEFERYLKSGSGVAFSFRHFR